MTDNPIDIPALIDQTRHAHIQGVSRRQAVPILGQCLAALEQAQAEIAREKARADAAESSEVSFASRCANLRSALDRAVSAHSRAQEEGTRLRDALRAGLEKAYDLVANAAARGHDGWDTAGRALVKAIRAALAANKETT